MKKLICVLLLSMVLVTVACGSSATQNATVKTTEKGKPVDLKGNWAQEGKESEDSFQAGYINGDRIEIFWMSEGGNTSNLYWSGTYQEPKEAGEEYTWVSKNDKTRTDSAFLASGDDQKTFTYKDGKLSYEVSIMGETATVKLMSTDTDYASLGTGTESADTSNLQGVKLTQSGYSITSGDGSVNIYYAVKIANPNEEYAIAFPKIMITAKGSDGKILTTEEMVLNGIAAGDEYTYGNSVYYEGEAPESVEISVSNGDNDYEAQSSSDIISSKDFTVSNTAENVGTFKTFTGEVTNNSTKDFDSIAVVVIYKSGEEIKGGEVTYVDDVKAGETKPFELSAYSNFTEYDSYEIHALQW